MASIGSSALLRVAGLPIRLWVGASNPCLFSKIRALEEALTGYSALAARLAVRIGEEVVPHQMMSKHMRAVALDVRRALHRGEILPEPLFRRLLPAVLDLSAEHKQLADALSAAHRRSRSIVALQTQVVDELRREQGRLVRTAWESLDGHPIARSLLAWRTAGLGDEIRHHLAKAESWDSKKMRGLGEYFWKMIDRAACRSTPRDWHGQVALIAVDERSTPRSGFILSDQIATVSCENLHLHRRRVSRCGLTAAAADVRISITPLWSVDGEYVTFWIPDPESRLLVTEVRMRCTQLLSTVLDLLSGGASKLTRFMEHLKRAEDIQQLEMLRKFIEYLVDQQVLQLTSTPNEDARSWRAHTSHESRQEIPSGDPTCTPGTHSHTPGGSHRFLDIYRRTDDRLSLDYCLDLQRSFELAQRVLAAIHVDHLSTAQAINEESVDGQPRPVTDLLAEHIASSQVDPGAPRPSEHWPPPRNGNSSYARILQLIAASADVGSTVNLDHEDLNRCGAPNGVINWPVDCVLRIPQHGCNYAGILEEAFPAGSLDARFLSALRRLHGTVPHSDHYREFLALLEQASDMEFLELLIPPLSEGAANAVKRPPLYTRHWTGDPDLLTFCAATRRRPKYIPLNRVTLRRAQGRTIVEANGRPVCPMYHATRRPLPPWDTLAEWLLGAAPLPMRWAPRPLHRSLDAFSDRVWMPRIIVGGALVLAGAQWRIRTNELWDGKADALGKALTLNRLRTSRGLPRWVFVSSQVGKPEPCDLESVRAIKVLERGAMRGNGEFILVEMLPRPDQLLVTDALSDPDDRLVSSIMLRFPCNESPAQLATRLAPSFSVRPK